jgi:hypothetical protein
MASSLETTFYLIDASGATTSTITTVFGSTTTEYSTYTTIMVFPTNQIPTTIFFTNSAGEIIRTSTIVFYLSSDTYTLVSAFTTTVSTMTTKAVVSPAFSSRTTNTNSAFDPSTSTSVASAGLSSGAKAGIGVGVAVSFLIFVAFIAGCLIVRRRRRRQSPLSEVASPAHEAGYHKPELDATVMPKPSDRGLAGGRPEKPELETNLAKHSPVGVQANGVELDGASKRRTDGSAELDGCMVPKSGKIT